MILRDYGKKGLPALPSLLFPTVHRLSCICSFHLPPSTVLIKGLSREGSIGDPSSLKTRVVAPLRFEKTVPVFNRRPFCITIKSIRPDPTACGSMEGFGSTTSREAKSRGERQAWKCKANSRTGHNVDPLIVKTWNNLGRSW